MRKEKLIIAFELNIQYRNLVGSGLLKTLAKEFSSITVLSNNDNIIKDDTLPSNVKIIPIRKYRFRKIGQALWWTSRYQNAINTKNNPIHRKKWLKGLSSIWYVKFLHKILQSNSKKILEISAKLNFLINIKKWKKLDKFDLFLSINSIWQYYDALIGLYFQKKKKPWVVLVTSWDNPTSKGEFVFNPHKVIVWGQQNYIESIKYLGLPESTLINIAPPHFAILKMVSNTDGFDEKKHIFYIGVTEKNYTWEIDLVRLLFRLTINQPELINQKILLRPHPNDKYNWWKEFDSHKNLILDSEVDINQEFVYSTDGKNLEQFYKNIKNSSCIISYQSTVCIEAGLLKIPVLIPMFKPGDSLEKKMPHDEWPHMKYVLDNIPEEYLIKSEEQLLEMIRKCKNGKISKESINKFYNVCLNIANIEQDIFSLYKKELRYILNEQ